MAAEAAISSAVELLANLLIKKVQFLQGVREQVELLKEELSMIQCLLKDANQKQAGDKRVRKWISDIREVAQDAEDVIETFVVKQVETQGMLGRLTAFPKHTYHINKVGKEIQAIQKRLESINKMRETYEIKDINEVSDTAWRSEVESRRPRLPTWRKDEQVVDVDGEVEKILQESIFNEERKGLSVAVIEGMGGIGKSTLGRKIYHHPDVSGDRFDCRGWVVVSSDFRPLETIRQLIFELPLTSSDIQKVRELEELMGKDKLYLEQKLKEMLHKLLEGKSYFIVLDDVWEKEHFESLIAAFPTQQDKRSRILVTSRNKIKRKYDQYVHKMKLLDSDKSRELLLKKANIVNTNGRFPAELEDVGKQILEKCDGLPLAISVVGGLLVESQTQSRWNEVLNQINSYLGRAESSDVSSILELSYQNLSPQLKSCFLRLAFFKEGYTISAKRLVSIWVGQGLIQHEENRKVDEIARGYINELINRSMLQIEDPIIDNRVKNCRLHDLLRKLCLRKAEEVIGLEIVKGGKAVSSESWSKPRHRVVYGQNFETCSLNQNKHLRSLFLLNVDGDDGRINVSSPTDYWKSFQLLKILDIDGFELQRFPDSLRLLIGLKCLRIHKSHVSFFDRLELPSWLDNFKSLEVLSLENQSVMFPDTALHMESMRHFNAYSVTGRAMRIENWKNIESLKGVRVEDVVECGEMLIASCNIRELGIHMNGREGNYNLRTARATLEKMKTLEELHLESDVWCSMEEIIPRLESVTVLKVSGGMLKCGPGASVLPPNVSHLTLEGANLYGDPLQEVGKLRKLQYLTLFEIPYEGWTMKVSKDGFPCLEALSLQKMHNLKVIDIEEGGMPCLKHVQVHRCRLFKTGNLPKHIVVSAA